MHNANRELPEFPALAKCVLVDARHRSRKLLASEIRSSMLYDEVIEAKSVADGLSLLFSELCDSCFIGPTLSPPVLADLLSKGSKESKRDECAFIIVLKEQQLEDISEELLADYRAAGAHNIIAHPSSANSFIEGAIRAVIRANPNSSWTEIATTSGLLDRIGALAPIIQPGSLVPAFASIAPALKRIALEIANGSVGLNERGEPTKLATATISRIVQQTLAGDSRLGRSKELTIILENLLARWVIDFCTKSESAASARLRDSLIGLS